MSEPKMKICRRGHSYVRGTGCKDCRRVTAAVRRQELHDSLAAVERPALPPPARPLIPPPAYTLSPEQLDEERAAYHAREAIKSAAAIERSRARQREEYAGGKWMPGRLAKKRGIKARTSHVFKRDRAA